MKKFCDKLARPLKEVDPEVMAALYRYSWPGNVRELENIIERAIVLSKGTAIMPEDLPAELRESPEIEAELDSLISFEKGLTETLDAIEERIIRQALKKAGNVQAQAAKTLGISRSNLQYKMKKYGLLV
jgi:two-component system NtrC family response regulator